MKPNESLEAEQAILSAMLQGDAAVADDALDSLLPEDFSRAAHGYLFGVMRRLHASGTPIDPVTLSSELKNDQGVERAGGLDYLTYLVDVVPTGANAGYYAAIIRHRALERRVLVAAQEIAALAESRKTEGEALAGKAESILLSATERANPAEAQRIRETLLRVGDLIEHRRGNQAELMGIGTGLKALDDLTGGWRDGTMNVIAARPGEGKTSFGLRCAHYAAVKLGIPTVFFSLEMGAEQIAMRLLSSHTLIDLFRLERGAITDAEIAKIARAMGSLGTAPLFVDESAERSVGSLRAATRRLHRREGVRFCVVDYVQLIDNDDREENRQQEMRMVSKGLRAMAKQLHIPVLALCQVSRSKEQRGADSRPKLHDLKETGAWEQDAYSVVFPWTNPEDVNTYPEYAVPTTLIVGKHRNGPTGDAKVFWDRKTGAWRDITQQQQAAA